MKFPIGLFFILVSFSFSASAQTAITDAKLDDLPVGVKTVVLTQKLVSGYAKNVMDDDTKYQTTKNYDRFGNLTTTLYEGRSNSQLIFSQIDGFKTFKTVNLEKPKSDTVQLTADPNEKPIEEPKKLSKPDERYDLKYVYETANNGLTITERQFLNNGKLFIKTIMKFDVAGKLISMYEEGTVAKTDHSYRYDDHGNLVEKKSTRDIKGDGSDSVDRTVYSDIKVDSHGNWIEQKVTTYSKTKGFAKYNLAPENSTFVDIEYRDISYY